MAARLTFSVGKGGVNHTADVLKVQRFLNQVPPNEGGPIHRLPESGIYTDQTDLALKDYVWHQDFVIGAALESGQGQRGRLSPLLPGGMTTKVAIPKVAGDSKEVGCFSFPIKGMTTKAMGKLLAPESKKGLSSVILAANFELTLVGIAYQKITIVLAGGGKGFRDDWGHK